MTENFMLDTLQLSFDQADLAARLADLDADGLDSLAFGVIAIDPACAVRRYNVLESTLAGLSPQRVLGHHLFEVVAPCMNNFMVAQRFEDAAAQASPLDTTLDYVLTLRMRPVRVRLRLLAQPGAQLRYVLVHRRSS
jgi:photoactive yellow protein